VAIRLPKDESGTHLIAEPTRRLHSERVDLHRARRLGTLDDRPELNRDGIAELVLALPAQRTRACACQCPGRVSIQFGLL